VPAYLSLISGLSAEDMAREDAVPRARWRLLAGALGFILGFGLVTVVLLGGLVVLVGGMGKAWMLGFRILGATVLLAFALHLLGVFRIQALFSERRLHLDPARFGPLGAVVVGAAFAFGWSPCIGPILGGVLALAAGSAKIGLLIVYTLGLAVPFLLAALFLGAFLRLLTKATRYLRAVEIVSGILLLAMAALLVTDQLKWLAALAMRLFPGAT
jgi:cytochrome c-type biogenesis protein